MGLSDDIKNALQTLDISQLELSRRSAVPQPTLSRFMRGQFGAEPLLRLLDALGAQLVFPGEAQLQDASRIGVDLSQESAKHFLASGDYLAVPMVGEGDAILGVIPDEHVLSWVIVYKLQRSVLRCNNLLAIEIGPNQRSMIPTLHPGDIVLIDRSDWGQEGLHAPGNIFLVRDPGQVKGGKVSRAALSGKGKQAILTFYGDNTMEYAPEPYPAAEYGYEIRNAILGRVVWAWADISRK